MPCAFRCWPTVAILIIVAMALSACQSCPPVSERTVCPAVKEYSKREQAALADELGRLAPGTMLGVIAVDYGELRRVLRACRGG